MVQIKNITKSFGELEVFKNFSLDIESGKITALLGPSGCGKTTLLRILSGLEKIDNCKTNSKFTTTKQSKSDTLPDTPNQQEITPHQQEITFGQVTGVPNDISYIFQEPRLLPFKTVFGNIDFVLKQKYPDKPQRLQLIEKYLEMTGILESKNFYPKQLSGGMAQRVSIARAFAYPSTLHLWDEPFNALDTKIAQQIFNSIIDIIDLTDNAQPTTPDQPTTNPPIANPPPTAVENRQPTQSPLTVIFVTHSISDALLLADKVVILGERGTGIKNILDIPTNRKDRSLTDNTLATIRQQILQTIYD
ncbi:MAG: ABC transporter ATP-binding protein [Firmicutes bacterium]|nr:ABC transporter ATP-binding protein [Bacillota bacterium]